MDRVETQILLRLKKYQDKIKRGNRREKSAEKNKDMYCCQPSYNYECNRKIQY